jgi:hypothetical protein
MELVDLLVAHHIPVTHPKVRLVVSAAERTTRVLNTARSVTIKDQVGRAKGQQPLQPAYVIDTLNHEHESLLRATRHPRIIPEPANHTGVTPGRLTSLRVMPRHRAPPVEPCVFCGAPSSRAGEHVLPRWLLRRWHGQGPFTHELNGRPIRDRRGAPRTASDLPPNLLAVCDQTSGQDCNGRLNRLYEQPAKRLVRAVLDQAEALDGTSLVAAFARWWIKTILLLGHARTTSAFPGAASRSSWDLPVHVYQQLLTGAVPSDISLWLAVSDDANGAGRLPERVRMFLPTTSAPDCAGGKPATLLLGFHQAGTRVLLAQLVLHPLCDLEHPFERAGLAVRVWPDPPERLDVTTLPALDTEGRDQLGSLFVDGGFAEHLPTAGWRTSVEAAREGEPLRLPASSQAVHNAEQR